MSRLTLGLFMAFVVSALLALWGWTEVEDARKERDAANVSAAASLERLAAVQTNLRRVKSDYATSELRLSQVLGTLPDARTPDPVYNELCARANCAKLDPLSAPAD